MPCTLQGSRTTQAARLPNSNRSNMRAACRAWCTKPLRRFQQSFAGSKHSSVLPAGALALHTDEPHPQSVHAALSQGCCRTCNMSQASATALPSFSRSPPEQVAFTVHLPRRHLLATARAGLTPSHTDVATVPLAQGPCCMSLPPDVMVMLPRSAAGSSAKGEL